MKILILKPSSLGDVVQALPVLRLLKRHFPAAQIYWWIEVRTAALLEGDPDLAGIFRFDRERWATPWHWPDIWNAVADLRRERFDLVIDLQALARSAAVGWLANGTRFIGLHDWRELAPGCYDASVSRPSRFTHAVDWYLEVLRVLDVPIHFNFEWLPKREAIARQVETLFGLDETPTVALLPGARWENKRWPTEHFAELVRHLRGERPNIRFAVLGGKSDAPLAQQISAAAHDGVIDLTGRTTLPQMVEVLRKTSLVITNDTGPMHVAAALGKPVVGIFGPTEPRRTGAYGQIQNSIQERRLPCVPCMRATCRFVEPLACLRRIMPQTVAERALSSLTA